MPVKLRALWRCPKCGARFVTRNMWHSCGTYRLEDLFARSEPHVRRAFEKFAEMVRACGPVTMIPQKTRVVFMVRIRFAGAVPRKSYLWCTLGLPNKCDHSRFTSVETFSPRFHGHRFRVDSAEELDEEVQEWIRESYALGRQEHLET